MSSLTSRGIPLASHHSSKHNTTGKGRTNIPATACWEATSYDRVVLTILGLNITAGLTIHKTRRNTTSTNHGSLGRAGDFTRLLTSALVTGSIPVDWMEQLHSIAFLFSASTSEVHTNNESTRSRWCKLKRSAQRVKRRQPRRKIPLQ